MRKAMAVGMVVIALAAVGGSAVALDSPWIGVTYFYWYQWDYAKKMGGWLGGVYNTPLMGYYDSARLDDNTRQLHCASEWGVTHHFMDFWGDGWLDERGRARERCVMDAAEAVRAQGYDIWMSYYQDGTNFQMDDFAKNMDPGRDVESMVKKYPASAVWPKIDGKPQWLVYGRNGSPKTTATSEGFREWLKAKYGTPGKLAAAWGQEIKAWEQAEFAPDSVGVQRADSIKYQYELWAKSIAEMNAKVRAGYGFPGIIPSFDIAYQPYNNWGYSLQAKTFCGPHSYGGIFGQPQEQDVERYIQAAVAKWYGTAFFDTYKNYYHDWEIRVPGIVYPEDPYHFDRFWTVVLAHYAEAMLHLSWNEWWEGSNLEPSWEYGKTYCEKNLLYATVMKAAFESIRKAQTTGEVAVLVNDWQWLASGQASADIYGAIQALRAAGVDFKLLPDDFVNEKNLADVRVVVAPGAGVGFGANAEGQQIADVLQAWLAAKTERKIVLSALPGPGDGLPAECGSAWREKLGLKPMKPAGGGAGPASINALVDIGEKGDEAFLLSGYSGQEDWGKLPGEAFGAQQQKHTVRWTPGTGRETKLLVPTAPGKEHILTVAGDAAWPNEVEVLVNGKTVGRAELKAAPNQFDVTVPAEVVGEARLATVTLRYATMRVPNVETQGKNTDARVCNLAIDWVQIRTADQPADKHEAARLPEGKVRYEAALKAVATQPVRSWGGGALAADGAQVLSRYGVDGGARDMVLAGGKVWYCNGFMGDVSAPEYWDGVLKWAGVKPTWAARGDGAIGARLQAGSTTLMPVYSTDITKKRTVQLEAPAGEGPLAEAQAITRDGKDFEPLKTVDKGGRVTAVDELRYYGLYQMTFCPVRPENFQPPDMAANCKREFAVRLPNLTRGTVKGRVTLRTWLPSLTAPWVDFAVAAGGTTVVTVPLTGREDLEWGRKTVALVVDVGGREAYFWRPLTVVDEPQWKVEAAGRGEKMALSIQFVTQRWAERPRPKTIEVLVGGKPLAMAQRPDWWGGVDRQAAGAGEKGEVEIRYELLGQKRVAKVAFDMPPATPEKTEAPADALAAFVVPWAGTGAGQMVSAQVEGNSPALRQQGAIVLRDREGREAPATIEGTTVLGMLPSAGPGPFFECPARTQVSGDLRIEKLGDGRVRVRNSEIMATFDPAKGGTITELRRRGGRNVAQNSFGASWGKWGKFDPLTPAMDAAAFLKQERKNYQWERPADVTVLRNTGLGVIVTVTQRRDQLVIEQRYTFYAYQPFFQVTSGVSRGGEAEMEEVAVIDASLDRGPWDKIFPNFTGVVTGEPAIHGGWREAHYVPPYATVMTAGTFRDSLSLVRIGGNGVNWWRQGLYPRKRGEVGTVDTARMEIISRRQGREALPMKMAASAIVLLHDGYQIVAEAATTKPLFSEAWQVEISGRKAAAGKAPGDWWCQAFDARARVEGRPEGKPVVVAVPAQAGGKWLQPESVVAVWQTGTGPMVIPCEAAVDPGGDIMAKIDKPEVELGDGSLWIYARTGDKAPEMPKVEAEGVPDPSFEKGGEGWQLAGVVVDGQQPHSGKASVKLFTTVDGGFAVASTDLVAVRPKSKYNVAFWARTEAAGAIVNVNFFAGATYDFLHVGAQPPGDGQWHRYEVETPTGEFPLPVRPALRLWVYKLAGPVWIDDVEVKAVEEPVLELPRARVEVLK
jgi:hypothetical protein